MTSADQIAAMSEGFHSPYCPRCSSYALNPVSKTIVSPGQFQGWAFGITIEDVPLNECDDCGQECLGPEGEKLILDTWKVTIQSMQSAVDWYDGRQI